MDPDGGARDARAELEALRRLGDGADDGPHERTLPLAVDPRVVVVGDEPEREAALLGHRRVAGQLAGAVLLARELVADLQLSHHADLLPGLGRQTMCQRRRGPRRRA